MIATHRLTKRFGDALAVDELCLDVRPGEIFGFLGPNGSGKTTTIRMLAGLLRATSGTASVAGFDVAREPEDVKRHAGYMADRPFLHNKLTGREFLQYLGDLHSLSPRTAADRIARLLSMLELDDKADELIEGWSHGMRQKLALAGAMLHEPQVLILDEPTSGMDPRSARAVKQVLTRMAGQGCSVLVTTHLLDAAERLCDRVGIIHRGRLVAVGTVDQLRHRDDATLEDVFIALTADEPVDG